MVLQGQAAFGTDKVLSHTWTEDKSVYVEKQNGFYNGRRVRPNKVLLCYRLPFMGVKAVPLIYPSPSSMPMCGSRCLLAFFFKLARKTGPTIDSRRFMMAYWYINTFVDCSPTC